MQQATENLRACVEVKNTEREAAHAPRLGHSVKPERFYEIIEAAYPTLPKIELFCRKPRPGWSVWGNQAAGR